MQSDTRTGLALGILLVGVVGAFYFRNDDSRRAVSLELQNPQILDAEIADQPVGPYLTEPEFDAPEAASEGQTVGPEAVLATNDPWKTTETTAAAVRGTPPAPVGMSQASRAIVVKTSGAGEIPVVPVPSHNRAWEPGAGSLANTETPDPLTGAITYRVRTGDTLSGLAARHLGSSTRFREIYDANRDLLRSPDDLRVGMTIRIPSAASPPPAPAERAPNVTVPAAHTAALPAESPAESPVVLEAPTSGEDMMDLKSSAPESAAPRLFTPVRRPPLMPGKRTTDHQPIAPIRSLTQVPPDELPHHTAAQ